MLRFIVTALAALIACAGTALLSKQVYTQLNHWRLVNNHIVALVKNPHATASKIFSTADVDAPIVGNIEHDGYAAYNRPGTEGRWHYIYFDGKSRAVHGSKIEFGHYLFQDTILEQTHIKKITYGSAAFCLLMLLFGFRKGQQKPARHKPMETQYPESQVQQLLRDTRQTVEQETREALTQQLNQTLARQRREINAIHSKEVETLKQNLASV